MNNYIFHIVVYCSVTIAAFSQILLKKGAMRPHISFIKDYLNPPVIAGYGLMFLSVLATMYAYRGLPYMSIAVAESMGFILVPTLSYFFFKEKFTKYKVIGIVIILVGVMTYNMGV